jgi:hypothetical protein
MRWIYLLETTSLVIPEWAQKLQKPDFERDPMKAWLPRWAAKMVAAMDREDGGSPTLTKSEYRRCPVCGTLYLQLLAERRRLLDRGYTGRMKTCGPNCQQRARENKAAKRKAA